MHSSTEPIHKRLYCGVNNNPTWKKTLSIVVWGKSRNKNTPYWSRCLCEPEKKSGRLLRRLASKHEVFAWCPDFGRRLKVVRALKLGFRVFLNCWMGLWNFFRWIIIYFVKKNGLYWTFRWENISESWVLNFFFEW